MPPAGQHIHVYGNAAISTGSHSAAQQGSDQQAHGAHHAGVAVGGDRPLRVRFSVPAPTSLTPAHTGPLPCHRELQIPTVGCPRNRSNFSCAVANLF